MNQDILGSVLLCLLFPSIEGSFLTSPLRDHLFTVQMFFCDDSLGLSEHEVTLCSLILNPFIRIYLDSATPESCSLFETPLSLSEDSVSGLRTNCVWYMVSTQYLSNE